MAKKIRVGVIFGGRSAEHEVSIQSAKNVIAAIDKEKYEIVLIGIGKVGKWYLDDLSKPLMDYQNSKLRALNRANEVTLVSSTPGQLLNTTSKKEIGQIDVVFPILHGTYGEDGTIQGMLKLMDVPFVGASVLGSAIGMDKEVAKKLLRQAEIPVAEFIGIRKNEKVVFGQIEARLKIPFFVKPANLGSSVGIYKVKTEKEFKAAVKNAFLYDNKILCEEYIKGREIECSVLGNEDPIASIPGEIITSKKHPFYDYTAKYIDEKGAELKIPAELTNNQIEKIKDLAIQTFKTLECEGMGRVDFFLKENGDLCVNEINTIPGFTKISMYPKLWEASGISYKELIDKLIILAIERFKRDKKLKTSF